MSALIYLSASLAMEPQLLPRCCVRHGQPATDWKRITFTSRPPAWVYLTLVLGLLPTVVILLAMRRELRVPAWPVCRSCGQLRRRRLLYGVAGGAAWFVICLAAVTVAGMDDVVGPLGLIGAVFVTPFLILTLCGTAGWATLANAAVTRDGLALAISAPSAPFVAALPPVWPPAGAGYR